MNEKKLHHSCCTGSRAEVQSDLGKGENVKKREFSKRERIKFRNKLIYIPGGEFLMGTNDEEGFISDGEGPTRSVKLSPYYIDSHTVTNEEFAQFVEETGYRTEAEIFGWSFVFYKFLPKDTEMKVQQLPSTPWWYAAEGAYWFQPEGKESSIEERMDHPVIHVSWNDAMEFCNWSGKRLPTEAEWEMAARGGLEQKKFPWGDELTPGGKHYCNIWQGEFPKVNTEEDGFVGTAPSQSFPPNGYGLYNTAGNVWEWCSDWFAKTSDLISIVNPRGPVKGEAKVIRGGSYLCHPSYCNRYRVAARSSNTIDSSSGNMGFRCVVDANS
ncbi:MULTISPECIES: formylglycine-generating enzyme family protein [Bacillales]|uniref:formylglycine-generating enzyme family protein n=1 Tax=Bacillales TaxID=1385 RepID=UPI0024B3B07A|nr:formylglycine-generating enzyme family protein [Pseudalkalibacillus hwajinpoensis]